MGISGSDGERFIDNRRITGPIPDMLEEAVKFVRRNSRTKQSKMQTAIALINLNIQ